MKQVSNIALAVTEAERQEKVSEIFFKVTDKPTDHSTRIPCRRNWENENTGQVYDSRVSTQHNKFSHSTAGNAQKGATMKCYECERLGHFAIEYTVRLKRKEILKIHPGGKTRVSVQNVQARPERSPSPRKNLPGSRKQDVKETNRRRKWRQFASPQHS
jgi:hypothetical protein